MATDAGDNLALQFNGFLHAPQICAENALFGYPFFHTNKIIPEVDLQQLPEPPTRVLGKRMEHFFHYYITHFSEEIVLAHNEQIILNKETLGELDFLLKNPSSGEISHVELVYKFYLYDPDAGSTEEHRWIGPNRRDSFAKKLQRLKTRQFPLLYHSATQPLLEKLDISAEKTIQKLCFKANLFLPLHHSKRAFSNINPEAIRGFWIHSEDFTAERYGTSQFFSPKKPFWPIEPDKNSHWLNFDEVQQHLVVLLERKQSPLIWMKTPEGEFSKFFIVWW